MVSVQSQLVSDWRSLPLPSFSSGHEGLPLGQCDRAAGLVSFSVDQVTLEIKMIVDVGMDGSEFLKRFHLPKPQHGPLSSSFLRHYDETKTLLCSIPHICLRGADGEHYAAVQRFVLARAKGGAGFRVEPGDGAEDLPALVTGGVG